MPTVLANSMNPFVWGGSGYEALKRKLGGFVAQKPLPTHRRPNAHVLAPPHRPAVGVFAYVVIRDGGDLACRRATHELGENGFFVNVCLYPATASAHCQSLCPQPFRSINEASKTKLPVLLPICFQPIVVPTPTFSHCLTITAEIWLVVVTSEYCSSGRPTGGRYVSGHKFCKVVEDLPNIQAAVDVSSVAYQSITIA
ncbi:uncharacterized protein LACBIDRAFT_333085 [Laccaria bicolor S238N-H82]|uniref:Predicted protein n=1 Tax=Laccaria bicolor (strain S238N-H82 / ATCC MYA-4686) TaxID=486041 RepID=B0DUT7_LACBS|nr:uncharacterized protein LACBIDRAFT_333085 [Laccaria bicolor S238N-H82]EDR01602.1 predicted protein [Laccaria bicolor S238N-H82]|eukprot:XP_001887678.1 predicted protein [Laccaria bicolor S238N-H82]